MRILYIVIYILILFINFSFGSNTRNIDNKAELFQQDLLKDPQGYFDEEYDYINFSFLEKAPIFIAPKLTGGVFFSSDFVGDINKNKKLKRKYDLYGKDPRKYLVISFFASYCKPCRKEIPELLEFQKKILSERDDIQVVLISMDKTKTDAINFINSNFGDLSPIIILWSPLNNSKAPAKLFNVNVVPTLIILNKDGKILLEHQGYKEGFPLKDAIEYIIEKYENEYER